MDSWNKEQTAKMTTAEKKLFKDYNGKQDAENDLDTLMRATEIKKNSKRLKLALACGKLKKEELGKAIESIPKQ